MFEGFKITKLHLKFWIIIIVIAFIVEMCIVPRLFLDKIKKGSSAGRRPPTEIDPDTRVPSEGPDGFSIATYYSNWSPYNARNHKPADIPTNQLTHVYYAFFVVDAKSGAVKSSDSWSDFEMPLSMGVKGCIKELQKIKLESKHEFKTILCLGGWSNRDAYKKIAKSEKKVKKFIETAVDCMFRYGFDGIDLDWEFPEEDSTEPIVYLEMMKGIREGMDQLERQIFGSSAEEKDHPHFQLSVATPAFAEKLNILPIPEMSKYVDIWNMMCYDFHGEWSEVTGYHSNLYLLGHSHRRSLRNRISNSSLSSDTAVKLMTDRHNISSRRIALGMAAYGRGFTNVETNDDNYLGKTYHGVGGGSEGEPGIWLYNQLPIDGSKEQFDSNAVSAYCFDPKSRTFVGYDNVQSMDIKGKYIKKRNLNGGFWWESCGDSKDPSKSLVNAFSKEIGLSEGFVSLYKSDKVKQFHLQKYPKDYISSLFQKL
ncbi:Cts2 [Kluyveromyces lactis]|nr:Cts2 [Kluyveromyces lactis]